jgi:hypothetical protein
MTDCAKPDEPLLAVLRSPTAVIHFESPRPRGGPPHGDRPAVRAARWSAGRLRWLHQDSHWAKRELLLVLRPGDIPARSITAPDRIFRAVPAVFPDPSRAHSLSSAQGTRLESLFGVPAAPDRPVIRSALSPARACPGLSPAVNTDGGDLLAHQHVPAQLRRSGRNHPNAGARVPHCSRPVTTSYPLKRPTGFRTATPAAV